MDDLRAIPSASSPTIAKVVALKLPMETIKGFVGWLSRENSDLTVATVFENIDGLLYWYYNIDVVRLQEEVERRKAPRNPA